MPNKTTITRFDSLPISKAIFTEEGYLIDHPILTTVGIFEYLNPDGSYRRELRLPEEVFDDESLKSYKGKPIIITHDAGLINKDNVANEQVGTILSEGYQSGDNVIAEIVIHDTDEMRNSGLKELSLGYNLDLEETSGVWNGEHYDAIQRNIRINHLALVRDARAGEQARLNIDHRDTNTLKGGKLVMKKKKTFKSRRNDSILSPEELSNAIKAYKERKAKRAAAAADEDDAVKTDPEVAATEPETVDTDADNTNGGDELVNAVEEQVKIVKDHRDSIDEAGDPKTVKEAQGIIAVQDEDIGTLMDIIDSLLAMIAFDETTPVEETATETEAANTENTDDDAATSTEGAENPEGEGEDDKADMDDCDTEEQTTTDTSKLNADSIDRIVRTRIQLGIIGRKLNLDSLEDMDIMTAKKAVIKAIRPSMRLDGKSASYINAAYEMAVSEVNTAPAETSTSYQKHQMFNKLATRTDSKSESGAKSARERMIAKLKKEEK